MKTIFRNDTIHITLEGVSILVNGKRLGFRMTDTEGVNRIVIHKKLIERSFSEYGFLVPEALLKCNMLFEVKMGEDKYTHFFYYHNRKNRLIPTGDHVFIGLGPLDVDDKAEHIKKVRL